MTSLHDSRIHQTLVRLHRKASKDMPSILAGFVRSLGRKLQPSDMRRAYIAVSAGQGNLLYSLARASGAKNIIEFGTSFGISALYLGAAARDNGGRLITTEIEPNKCAVARANISEAGLADVVSLLEGNALETLAAFSDPVDFLFLDGWNDLYPPLLELLGPRLRDGSLVLVDNAGFPGVKRFLRRLRATPQFTCSGISADKGRMEVACFSGPWAGLAGGEQPSREATGG